MTQANSGETITLSVGQTLEVRLSGSAADPWSPPDNSNPRALAGRPTGVMATQGSVIADYAGSADGQARVTSTETPSCRRSTPQCEMPSREFFITVDVVG